MGWSISLGTIAGTRVRIHITFLLFLVWLGAAYWAKGGVAAAAYGLAFIVLLFLCVVLHEFGHILTARRFGVKTPDVTLFPIGGIARMERIPEKPGQELTMALAGPLVNLVIASALFLALGDDVFSRGIALDEQGANLLPHLAVANLILALFNLLPAFPMDGGRALRALLAYRLGRVRATRVAASIGQMLAFGFGLLGLIAGNPILVFIALFVYLGAAAEAIDTQMQHIAEGLLVSDAMVTELATLSAESRIEDAVQILIRTTQQEIPIVDEAGRLLGLLTRNLLIQALHAHGPDVPVAQVMRTDIPAVPARRLLADALRIMREQALPAIAVADAGGRLAGLVTPENLGEMMMVQAARSGRSPAPFWRSQRPVRSARP